MINILHLSNSIGANKGGGISVVVKDYMIFQKNTHINSILWFPGSNEYDNELKNYKEFIEKVKLLGIFGKPNSFKIFLPQIFKELNAIDIIHQHSLWKLPSFLSLFFSKYKRKIVIIQPHGALSPLALMRSSYKKRIARFLYEDRNMRNSSMFIANSMTELNDIKKIFPLKEVAFIPHGISREFMQHPPIINAEYDILAEGKKIILFISRIHPIKGIDRLIEAINIIDKQKIKDAIFVIGGYGDIKYVNYLKKLIIQYRLETYFVFIGFLNKENKIALLDRSIGFILPSFTESFSLSIVEALSRGVPVITTQGTPWAELEKNNCGFWTENSIEGIISGLNNFFNKSEKELLELSLNAKELVRSKYILENNISQLEELYNYAMEKDIKPPFVF